VPIYEYEHVEKRICSRSKIFEIKQSINDSPLEKCPYCGMAICKLISHSNISTPKTNSELRDLGFSKLVKKDDGVYENVTARKGESKYMIKGKPETMPHLHNIIRD